MGVRGRALPGEAGRTKSLWGVWSCVRCARAGGGAVYPCGAAASEACGPHNAWRLAGRGDVRNVPWDWPASSLSRRAPLYLMNEGARSAGTPRLRVTGGGRARPVCVFSPVKSLQSPAHTCGAFAYNYRARLRFRAHVRSYHKHASPVSGGHGPSEHLAAGHAIAQRSVQPVAGACRQAGPQPFVARTTLLPSCTQLRAASEYHQTAPASELCSSSSGCVVQYFFPCAPGSVAVAVRTIRSQ